MNQIIFSKANKIYKSLFPDEYCMEYLLQIRNGKQIHKTSPHIEFKNIHWEKIFSLIRQNSIQTIFNTKIYKTIMPRDIYFRIAGDLFYNDKYSISQNKEFNNVLTKLHNAHVNFLVMKTYLQSNQLFGKQAHKIYLDLDILMPISEFRKSSQILLQDGYHWFSNHSDKHAPDDYLTDFHIPKQEEIFKKNMYDIEIHTKLLNTESFNSTVLSQWQNRQLTQKLFDNSINVPYAGMTIKTFSPTSMLMNLFLHHFYQHNYQGVIRFYEFAKLIDVSGDNIKWENIIHLLDKYYLQSYFLWYLCLLENLFPLKLPAFIIKKVTSFKKKFSILQLIIFFGMRYLIFHSRDFRYPDLLKKISWSIIDHRLMHAIKIQLLRVKT